ncbi:MAG: 30S ribosomal protein S20 [Chloroflexi bacterium]|nr:30S ribosomal protein S20 [Chloroflexota bacterium]
MAHSNQAKKRVRQNERRAARNRPLRTSASRRVRDAREAIMDGDPDAADYVRSAQSALDRAAKRNVIHRNAAARRKSRLAAQLKAAQGAD